MYSCSDTWDDHYNAGLSALKFNGTTMQALEETAPDFAKVVKAYGFSRELSSDNTYTVWAPADGSFNLSAQVKDFEMPSVQIAALPYSSVIEMPDTSEMEGGLESLSSAISQLNQGTAELANGAAQLSTGADSLAGGAKQFGNGLSTLASSSTQIVSASSQIKDVLAQIANALKDVDVSKIDEVKAKRTNYFC